MHPRQSSLLEAAEDLTSKLAAKQQKLVAQGAVLWKYTCPETTKDFYLEEKKTTVKSPWTGKTFSVKPVRYTPAAVGTELKEEQKAEKAEKTKKAAGDSAWKI